MKKNIKRQYIILKAYGKGNIHIQITERNSILLHYNWNWCILYFPIEGHENKVKQSRSWAQGHDIEVKRLRLRSKVHLFCQLFLTKLVECEELLGENDVLLESTGGELHADDDGTIRHHHSHRTEVDLQVLRQFLSSGITRVLWTGESDWWTDPQLSSQDLRKSTALGRA